MLRIRFDDNIYTSTGTSLCLVSLGPSLQFNHSCVLIRLVRCYKEWVAWETGSTTVQVTIKALLFTTNYITIGVRLQYSCPSPVCHDRRGHLYWYVNLLPSPILLWFIICSSHLTYLSLLFSYSYLPRVILLGSTDTCHCLTARHCGCFYK